MLKRNHIDWKTLVKSECLQTLKAVLSFFQALGPGGRSNEGNNKSSLEPPIHGTTSDPSIDFDSNQALAINFDNNQALKINFDNNQALEINFDSDQDTLNAESTEANGLSNGIPSTQPLTVSSTNRIKNDIGLLYFLF